MTKKSYGFVGQNFEQYGGSCPLGAIEMNYRRPSPDHVADASGDWVLRTPTADDVRAEANRRIVAVYPLWEQINRNRTGDGAVAMNAWIDSVRAASNLMEANPPLDYADDQHWPSA